MNMWVKVWPHSDTAHDHPHTAPPPFLQGEDVVAGTRTPLPISALSDVMPAVYAELLDITTRLEAHMKDMQVGVNSLKIVWGARGRCCWTSPPGWRRI